MCRRFLQPYRISWGTYLSLHSFLLFCSFPLYIRLQLVQGFTALPIALYDFLCIPVISGKWILHRLLCKSIHHILYRLNLDLNSDSIYRIRLEVEEHSQVEVKYELKECIKVDYKAEWHIGFLLVCIVSIPMPMYTLLSNTSSKSLLKAFFTNPPIMLLCQPLTEIIFGNFCSI